MNGAAGQSLKREAAGRYVSPDGRFSVEQSSGRWLVVDAESTDDLGLPLVRGPFATLDDARAAMEDARAGPAPRSTLTDRLAAAPARSRAPGARSPRRAALKGSATQSGTSGGAATRRPTPRAPEIRLRDYETGDAPALRALWTSIGLRSLGDDDRSLEMFAARNPGLLVLATVDGEIVGSALGGWDGRRGLLYHVATAPAHRRAGLATRLVRRVEQRLRALGCLKVNAIVQDDNEDARQFWIALGYVQTPARQLGREL